MYRVTIKPAWVLQSDAGEHFEPQLFALLRGIRGSGKLTHASRAAGLSYRHAWDLLAKWASMLGSDLVLMERGKGTRLTALGERLLWVEQHTEAALFPQLENIAAELNRDIGRARRHRAPAVRVHASHGYAIELLPDLLAGRGDAEIVLTYTGTVDAISALARGACDVAGIHVPMGELEPMFWARFARWIRPRQQRLIRMVTRTQGLMVARGNPLGIRGIADLARPRVRFVNRRAGSSTRALFDALIAAQGIPPRDIQGYDTGEFTHAAVAAYVASGMANVGLGLEPAARAFKLDFIPLVEERRMLVCKTAALDSGPVRAIVETLESPAFRKAIEGVPGYRLDSPGKIATFAELAPSTDERGAPAPALRGGSSPRAAAAR